MTFNEFEMSLQQTQVPSGLTPYLTALWHEKRNDWNAAHETVQEIEDSTASWIHAYLHRREGDESNARYWYGRAGKPFPQAMSLDDEWASIVKSLLSS